MDNNNTTAIVPANSDTKSELKTVGPRLATDGTVCENILTMQLDPRLDDAAPSGLFMDALMNAEGTGVTPSFITLFSGQPGAGKTTLSLQMADGFASKGCEVLYVTNEEAFAQVRKHARRLNLKTGFTVANLSDLNAITKLLFEKLDKATAAGKEFVYFIDSLQTVTVDGATGLRIAEHSCALFSEFCKSTYAIGWLLCQSTKNGDFAGRQNLKHMVDGHLQIGYCKDRRDDFFGKHYVEFTKNRFGIAGIKVAVTVGANGIEQLIE